MSFDDLNDAIKDLVAKADNIVLKEQTEKQRQIEITKAREEDGRLKIRIEQIEKQRDALIININAAQMVYEGHKDYFDMIFSLEGDHLIDALHKRFSPDEIRNIYWRALDAYRSLVGKKSPNELKEGIIELERELENLQSKRAELQTYMLERIQKLYLNLAQNQQK